MSVKSRHPASAKVENPENKGSKTVQKKPSSVGKMSSHGGFKSKTVISQHIDYINIINYIPQINNYTEVLQFLRKNTINAEYFNLLKDVTVLSDLKLSDWFHVSPKTFASYRELGNLPKENAQEHVIMILSLYKHAGNVFDNTEDFNDWLEKPNFFFDNTRPIDNLGTTSGIRFIDERLTALEYGDNV
jgi:hypothetical protein